MFWLALLSLSLQRSWIASYRDDPSMLLHWTITCATLPIMQVEWPRATGMVSCWAGLGGGVNLHA